jgi:uncharacterized membrane protein YeaQ/YmgE (transglycosylase-associated protein family)
MVTWTIANLVIQFVAGIIGGNAAAVLAKEHSFGALGHTMAGVVGGLLSGYFLQTLAGRVVNETGAANVPYPVTQWILQSLCGLVSGAILVLIVGLVRHGIDEHKS